ncbi:MAG: pyridoxal phosphate-dependent aminotransferase [Patescibacteria group bacterium]
MFADGLPESIIKTLSIRVKELKGVNFGQGIPSFPTAEHIRQAAREALNEKDIGVYPNFLGFEALRQAIADKFTIEYKFPFTIGHTLITVGAMEAVASSILSLIETGARVGIVTPDYCNHFPVVMLAKGTIVEIPYREEGVWKLDLPKIEAEAKKGLKTLIITNPSNPTGAVLAEDELAKLVFLSNTYGFWLVFDETYSFLTYDTPFISLLSFFDKCERLITIRSFSKEYAMTGWRVGYIVTRPETIKLIAKTHDALVGCVAKISQRAALAAITGSQEIVAEYRRILQIRRDVICNKLDTLGDKLTYAKPLGAYYIFPKYKNAISSIILSEDILQKTGVAVVPGAAFGKVGERHFRISYAVDDAVLEKGLEKLARYFTST